MSTDLAPNSRWQEVQQQVGILGRSEAIRRLLETIEQVAQTDISVLITGESGTGKELVARAIHARSRRRLNPLITVNCGAIPEGIIESELFGHEKGSFTGAIGPRKGYFELADKGSIFLDEIGELPLTTQVKLLRVLESREFMRVGGVTSVQTDVRFIAATNKQLEEEVRRGNFREDLFYRLNAVHIRVPALRERSEDIPILVRKFAQEFVRENHIDFGGFSESALAAMAHARWPGNIRELRNVVEKIIVLERGAYVEEATIRRYLNISHPMDPALPVPLKRGREESERDLLLRVLLEIKSEIAQLRELLLRRQAAPYPLAPWREDLAEEYLEPAQPPADGEHSSVAEMERELIQNALLKFGGSKRRAARALGLSERTLYRKIEKYGLKGTHE
ncbi:MAG TPA: sigma-54 dependent transcriptional regulator [bacterium]|nr:sigma-54 dependent transcriptional regulator [bacterium]HOC25653.1 sigma-54 dependent transcriptional regulator [bacterium]HPG83757.1 sigma-54 dependent transcriptional regulator [bacterium]HPM60791.1 sigma-54 dependent transcriptional regulator [bacterium]